MWAPSPGRQEAEAAVHEWSPVSSRILEPLAYTNTKSSELLDT